MGRVIEMPGVNYLKIKQGVQKTQSTESNKPGFYSLLIFFSNHMQGI